MTVMNILVWRTLNRLSAAYAATVLSVFALHSAQQSLPIALRVIKDAVSIKYVNVKPRQTGLFQALSRSFWKRSPIWFGLSSSCKHIFWKTSLYSYCINRKTGLGLVPLVSIFGVHLSMGLLANNEKMADRTKTLQTFLAGLYQLMYISSPHWGRETPFLAFC